MSRQAWIDTSCLLEAISEYIVRCNDDIFNGITVGDFNGLSNLLIQLSVATNGYQTNPRTPLQTMSNSFITFISSMDRCGYMLRPEWFNSDTHPNVSDDFISTYIKVRLQNPLSELIRQVNYTSLQPKVAPKLITKQTPVLKGIDTPYNAPVYPCDVFRASAAQAGNISVMGIMAAPPNVATPFFVAERDRILFGVRSPNAIPAGPQIVVVPQWASALQVSNARLYFTDSFFGTGISGVSTVTVAGEQPSTITVPTDINNFTINSDSIVSFSLAGEKTYKC